MSKSDTHWHHSVDTLIVGSGNGALTAAVCAHDMSVSKNGKASDVLVIEKSNHFGGTSALSGGGVWVPNNRYAKAKGVVDSIDEAFTYLDHAIDKDDVDRDMLRCYLNNAPKMVNFLHENTRVRYQSLEKYPDYYSDLPGAKPGHRSMEPAPIAFSKLGPDMDAIRPHGCMYMLYKYALTQVEAQQLISKLNGARRILFKLFASYYLDIPWLLKRKGFSRRTTGGGAGIIRLFLSLRDRNIPLWRNTAFKELILEDGKVIGAVVEKDGKSLNIRAKDAVLLAAGGFEHNQLMREQYLPAPTNKEWSAGCKHNTGDAIRAGIAAGAAVRLMNNAWWCTVKCLPDRRYPFLSIVNKSLPGSIVVNKKGLRFSNESQNYMAFLKESFALHEKGVDCIPGYMIFDHGFRQRRSVWPWALPDKMLPQQYFDSGLIAKGNTIAELANNLGCDVSTLENTVERFNGFVKTGKDLDFQRGDAAYDRYYGDPEFTPNPCLGAISKPPFYAVRLDAGDFGTQGGLVINENAQVCDNKANTIEGLYAFGNTTAAVLPTYPGPGSTLGPAMTFAYQAAKHIYDFHD